MKIIKAPSPGDWKKLIERPEKKTDLRKKVSKIIKKVKKSGDQAVKDYSKKFDEVDLSQLMVSEEEIREAIEGVPANLKKAIVLAKQNIYKFHKSQKQHPLRIETMPGVVCWRKKTAIEKVGLYIPGGTAPLFSTVLMLAVPAQLAGCKEIVICSPPDKKGKIAPAILFAAQLCGISKIFKVGGAQAIAALAYGTESIPAVYKIFGPGNQFVTVAKQLIQLDGIAIDMPAGPSELCVIADKTANPAFIAADLLSQAEHGADSQVMLLTDEQELAVAVQSEIKLQLKSLPRKELAIAALNNSRIILLKNMEEAVMFSNRYAPEHLIVMTENSQAIAEKITAAGSIFIGSWSPESAGDYATGTNHTLPTNGFAAMYSGLSLDSFQKTISVQQLTREGLENIGEAVMTMAEAEGLTAHKNAVDIRLKSKR